MAITDRSALTPGTKLVGKYKSETYHAEIVEATDEEKQGPARSGGWMVLMKGDRYKSLSAAGSAIFGVDKAGKPRTCNGFGFWGIDGEPAPAAQTPASSSTGRTRRKKDKPATDEAGVPEQKPGDGLPISKQLDDRWLCQECDYVDADRENVAAHVLEAHPAYAEQARERELATA